MLWNGKNLNTNRVGWFPSNHVQIVTDESYRVLNQEVVTYEVAEAFAEFQTSKERRMSLKVGDKIAVCTVQKKRFHNIDMHKLFFFFFCI